MSSASSLVPAVVAPLLEHVDLVERLEAVPESACVRGVHFKSLLAELDRRGLRPRYDAVFNEPPRAVMRLYPVTDYLVRLAYGGALVTSPERVHEGMSALMHGNAAFFAKSLLGRTIILALGHSPERILEQSIVAKRTATNYGRWTLLRHDQRVFEVRHEDEYVWIESALAGGAIGMVEACGVTPLVETKLVDRFNGSTWFRW